MERALMARGKRLDDEKIVKHMAKIQPKAVEYKNVGGESLDDVKKRRGTQSVATKGDGNTLPITPSTYRLVSSMQFQHTTL